MTTEIEIDLDLEVELVILEDDEILIAPKSKDYVTITVE